MLFRLGLPLLLILGGLWLRAPLVWADAPLTGDEALYATYGRLISHANIPLLNGVTVDKPPLAFYVSAASFKLFGTPSTWAARLPALFASLLTLSAVYRLARQLYRDDVTALLALGILALSPLDITFAATVFTDPLATLWIVLACLASTGQRWGWAGLLAGLAFATKQSAVQAVPLVLALGISAYPAHTGARRDLPRHLLHFGLGLSLPICAAFAWDGLRGPTTPGWWALGAANNAPGRFIRSDELLPRLRLWWGYLSAAAGGGALLAGGIAAGGGLLCQRIRRGFALDRPAVFSLILAAYSLGYVAVYSLVAFNTYNRYAHVLTPLLALLLARITTQATRALPRHPRRAVGITAAVLLIMLLPAAVQVRQGDTLQRADQARYTGITDLAAALNALPPGSIVYDHWLGWELGWYTTLDRPPGMWLRITYYPTPEALAADAPRQADDTGPRYFVAPDWVWDGPWLDALTAAGLPPKLHAQYGCLRLYVLPPPL